MASHYLWLWKQRGLVEPLGGHSDVFANLVVARQPNWEAALLLARPSAVLTGIECLRRAGWTTQIPARPEVAINGSLPLISSGRFDVQRRSDAWFASVQPGIHRDPRADQAADPSQGFAPALRPAWALADMLQRAGWAGCGLQPDDIDLDRLKDADRRDLARAAQAWAAAGRVAADLTNLVTSSRLVTLPGSTD